MLSDENVEHCFRACDRLFPVEPMRRTLQDGQQILAALLTILIGLRGDPGKATGEEVGISDALTRDMVLPDQIRLELDDAIASSTVKLAQSMKRGSTSARDVRLSSNLSASSSCSAATRVCTPWTSVT